ncbi:MAG: heavy-metal-associated domain-containing protein [Propioniciclava sp.]
MVDLNIKDAEATGGGCGCGCGHEAEASAPVQAATGGATTATYTVTGMTCDHCVKGVTEEVLAVAGVTSATVDLETGRLDIQSAEPIDFDRIVEAVAEAGDYSVS